MSFRTLFNWIFYQSIAQVCQDAEQIASYFQKLTIINEVDSKYIGQQIISEEELKTFLHANFKCFNPIQTKFPIHANCSNASLTRLFYDFYLEEYKKDSTSAAIFHKMLKDNFINFNNSTLGTIKKSFSNDQTMKYPFK